MAIVAIIESERRLIAALLSRFRGRTPSDLAGLAIKNIVHALDAVTPAARARRVADRAFDRRWGTDTSGGVSVHDLGFDPARIAHCKRYDPSDASMLRAPVAQLGIDPAAFAFVDYGAGKGRVMMLAMEMGFAHVRGVELSHDLCAIARVNIDRFVAQHPGMVPGEIVQGDATVFAPDAEVLVAYFYNPFDATIMAAVRDRLETALRNGTRRVIVVYANPEHAAVFADAPGWTAGPTPVGVATYSAEADAFRLPG